MTKENRSTIRRRNLQSYDEDDILEYLRQLARRLGKDTLTRYDIMEDGDLNPVTIHRKFGGFSEALIQAGLKPGRIYKRNPERMIQELADLMKELGREPKKSEMDKVLSYRTRHYEHQFESIKKAFDLAEGTLKNMTSPSQTKISSLVITKLNKTKHRRKYGPTIKSGSLRHAPINELGVVYLFGTLAKELGFEVESIQTGFPDCEAKLKNSDGTFERVMIEFEFKSSDFVRHKHDPDGCDLLVCWQHDWKECPGSIIVLDLSKKVGERERI